MPEFQRVRLGASRRSSCSSRCIAVIQPAASCLEDRQSPEIKNAAVTAGQDWHDFRHSDGQQRLTTLYLTRGEILPYYRAEDITNDPRDLYFDVETGDFPVLPTYLDVQKNPPGSRWSTVSSEAGINPFEIAKAKVERTAMPGCSQKRLEESPPSCATFAKPTIRYKPSPQPPISTMRSTCSTASTASEQS